jgi:hypothetical protein
MFKEKLFLTLVALKGWEEIEYRNPHLLAEQPHDLLGEMQVQSIGGDAAVAGSAGSNLFLVYLVFVRDEHQQKINTTRFRKGMDLRHQAQRQL